MSRTIGITKVAELTAQIVSAMASAGRISEGNVAEVIDKVATAIRDTETISVKDIPAGDS